MRNGSKTAPTILPMCRPARGRRWRPGWPSASPLPPSSMHGGSSSRPGTRQRTSASPTWLLTSHDLARQEKQKLELLRGLLTYYHYATTESRHEALQSEINRINAAANEQRDRYRSQ